MRIDSQQLTLRTGRLDLVAATLAHLDAELESSSALATLLEAEVPASWPPGEYDRDAIEFFRARLQENPEHVGWYGWYGIRRADGVERATLVAGAGYLGPPDGDGTVEVGYSVVPEFQGNGYATELVRALVAHAFSLPAITRVVARCGETNTGSINVLERCGFASAGAADEPETLRFVLTRMPAA